MKLTKERGAQLLSYARGCVREALGGEGEPRPEGEWCEAPAATFVTLRWADDDRLQGCIGSLEARRSLVDDVRENAVSAALHDPRFDPVKLDDVDALDFELSVLSKLEPIAFTDEASARSALRPGLDGVVFASRGRRSTLLPAMWPRLETPKAFLDTLKQKAGLSSKHWADDVRLWRYTVDEFASEGSSASRHAEASS